MSEWPCRGGLGTLCACSICACLQAQDLHGLAPEVLARLALQMQAGLAEQSRFMGEQSQRLAERDQRIAAQAQDIKFKDAKLEKITFELARLKAWRFVSKYE